MDMYACGIHEGLYAASTSGPAKAVMDRLPPVYSACLKLVAEAIIYSKEKTSSMFLSFFPLSPCIPLNYLLSTVRRHK